MRTPGWPGCAANPLKSVPSYATTIFTCAGPVPASASKSVTATVCQASRAWYPLSPAVGRRPSFFSIGIAGSIDASLHVGDLVLLTSALRDDGLSQHYLAPARYATPSSALTA